MLELQQIIDFAPTYLLIFARVISLFLTMPVISSQAIPSMAKAGLALFVSAFVLGRVVALQDTTYDVDLTYLLLVLGEVLLGLMMGLFLNVIMAIFESAGEYFAMPMGMATALGLDPLSNVQTPLLGQFFNLLALWIFVTIDGLQKFFLLGIYRSFEIVSAADLIVQSNHYASFWLYMLSYMFLNSFLISLPMLGVLFFLSIVLGLLARAAPQMNLLILGLPVQFSVGILMLVLSVPYVVKIMEATFENSFQLLRQFFNIGLT